MFQTLESCILHTSRDKGKGDQSIFLEHVFWKENKANNFKLF